VVARALDGSDANGPYSYPRARYLSQQFVEELCSSQGASEGLIQEVERVIFEAHSEDQRDGTTDFQELLDGRTMRFRQAQRREVEAIGAISDRIAVELEKESAVDGLVQQTAQKRELIKNYNADLAKLVVKGSEIQANRHAQLSQVAQGLTTKIQNFQNQRRNFVTLQDEVTNMRAAKSPEMLRQVQARYPSSGLSAAQWDDFLLIYKGDADKALTGYVAWADQEIAKLQGIPPAARRSKYAAHRRHGRHIDGAVSPALTSTHKRGSFTGKTSTATSISPSAISSKSWRESPWAGRIGEVGKISRCI